MNIRLLDESDAKIYKAVRLRALKNDQESFGSTYEQEVNRPLKKFAERIQRTKSQFTLGCFDSNHSLIGIANFAREDRLKTVHKGTIYGMYIEPEFRRRGLGRTLLISLIERATSECDGLEQIHLTVVSTNSSAIRLYTSLGFKVYGVEPNALKTDGKYFDEDLMILRLKKFN
ncbi:GNAT family N-acetyltransferase [Bacillus marinisedimentorum]|uniref:GNAT family N-acetyltransferase n=1 Tax=Bacillus marinisedimentorum TaxID=1821260 RepID=UPI0007DF76C8|nr:GNAT family N-acetyltransferase [Bacillus marinisedimentorum]